MRLPANLSRAIVLVGLAWAGTSSIAPPTARAVSSTVVISEFRVRGPSGGSDEFIELYNLSASPVSIGGWKVKGSNNAGGGTTTPRATIGAGVVLNPGCHFLLTNSSTSGGPYSGAVPGDQTYATGITDDGGIAVTLPDDTIVDQVGLSTGSAFKEGTPLASLGSSNQNRGYERKPGGAAGSGTDTDNNASDFQLISPSDPQNLASSCGPGPSGPTGVGAADPGALAAGGVTLLSVAVTPGAHPTSTGLTVTANLAAIGGSATQAFFDDGTHGDLTAGDGTFSFQATVAAGTAAGGKTLPVTIADAQLRTGSASITLLVQPPFLAIHDIQGSGSFSAHANELVMTRGIVTAQKSNGFFLQAPDAEADADPATSEGIFVFTGSAPPAAAAVGNGVSVTGTVQEFIPSADPTSPSVTEIAGSPVVSLVSTGNPLPTPITLTAADTDPAGSPEQLERFEGMRVHVDTLVAVSPTQGTINEPNATSTSNGVFYAVIAGIPRPVREPGIPIHDALPPGAPCCVPRFDENPERLRVDSDAQPGAATLDVATGTTISDVTGPLDYAFRTYTVLPDPVPPPVVSGGQSSVPVPVPGGDELTVASFNMERFFDTVNDPAISEPVLTAAAFDRRLGKASLAIRNMMRSPDLIGVEEMENLTTLQAVADRVNGDAVAAGEPNPRYQAFLVEGNDVGGIDVGVLAKAARVTVIDVTQEGKDATYINPNTGLPELLNDRPPLIARVTIQPPAGVPFPLTLIVNHLRSLSGLTDPVDGSRVRAKRRAQAEFLANLIQARQTADPSEHIVAVGDFNAYPFSDGYVDVMGTVKGTPTPPDQVVLASDDLVDPDLTDLVDLLPPEDRYSYSFDGNAQDLDHVLVTQSLTGRVRGIHVARNDADFPESFRNDGARPERLSDHDMPVASFGFPKADVRVAVSASPDPVLNGASLAYTLTVTSQGPDASADVTLSDPLPPLTTFQSLTAPAGWSCTTPAVGSPGVVTCTSSSLAAGTSAVLTLTAGVDCSVANGATLLNTATVAGALWDPDSANDADTAATAVLNPPPVITGASVDLPVLWPPNHKMVDETVAYQARDTCGPAPACSLGVTSSEPQGGPGSHSPDWEIVDTHHLRLRAEREGSGPGRVYTIAIVCRDPNGSASSQTVAVQVPHDRP